MIPKLSRACEAVRLMFHISNITTLKSIYFAYFHSVIKYGIISWGNSSNSGKIFTLQKKIIRIVVGARPRTQCRSLFTCPCQYIFSLMNCIVNNQENFQINSSIHNINIRNKHHFGECISFTSHIKVSKQNGKTKCQPILFSKKYII
jgi:hypothetical protein